MHFWSSPLVVFITQAFVIVAASRLIGQLTSRLRQPMVIAEIIAGIVLGPSVLGALLPSVEKTLFPATSFAALGLTSQVGLILFMFIIGLELHPKLLRGRAHTSVAISHASIVLPFILGAIIGMVVHSRLAPANVSLSSFVLFMGAAMSITAFPVLAKILVERRLLRSKIGAIAISCAAVDDVTAWCILAFVVSIVRSTSLGEAFRTVAFALVYIAVMVWGVRPYLHRFAGRTRVGLSQNLVAIILLLVLASSWLTELIGIHALFGAFLFGAVIPKEGSFAAALTEKIEDVVVVLLLPLFFAYSGLRTHIGLLDTPSAWLTCGVIIIAASIGKFGGSAVAARITGLSWREASAIGILMNTRGLMELIVLNIGLDLGVISPRLFTMMVLMALVTTFATTPLLELVYPLARFARELADDASTAPFVPKFTTLACVSQESSAPGLVTLGVAIAGSGTPDARMYALRLALPNDRAAALLDPSDANADTDLRADAILDAAIARGRMLNSDVRPLSFVSSAPTKDICDVAEVKGADLLLLDWHRSVEGDGLGDVVRGVISSSPREVAVLVDRGLIAVQKVLVGFAGSDHDRAALRLALRISINTNAFVTVIAVGQSDDLATGRTLERAAREELFSLAADRFEIVSVVNDAPRTALFTRSREGYDVVIMSVGAPWGIEHHSFALDPEQVIETVGCSVVFVRKGAGPVEAEKEAANVVATLPVEAVARFSTRRPPAA